MPLKHTVFFSIVCLTYSQNSLSMLASRLSRAAIHSYKLHRALSTTKHTAPTLTIAPSCILPSIANINEPTNLSCSSCPQQITCNAYKDAQVQAIRTNTALLHGAIVAGNSAVVETLIEQGVNIHVEDIFGRNALLLACGHNQIRIAHILLRNGARQYSRERIIQVDDTDIIVHTHLWYAAKNGFDSIVELLLNYNAPINQFCQDLTPLQAACMEGHSRIVKLLLDHDAEVDIQDRFGNTALHYAAQAESYSSLRRLINAHANTNICNAEGIYPWELLVCYPGDEFNNILNKNN